MLGAGYVLKIAKINFQQEKPICPNRKFVPAKHKKSPIRKNKCLYALASQIIVL